MSASIADIFRQSFDSYVNTFGKQPLLTHKVASAITACRTPILGGQREQCDSCGSEVLRYHSCRNRHCPRCQTTARMSWVQDRLGEILPVGYFHAVFTIPRELNPFALRNKKVFYDLMFRAVNETITELAANRKHLGADIGFIAVLHTWGQTLVDHPHIHCIIPGGGYDRKRNHWKAATDGFLFPINVVRALYRGKLMAFFRQAVTDGRILLHGKLHTYTNQRAFRTLVDRLYRKNWVVYIKEPFASAKALVKYLGNYTHRVALSDSRIIAFDNDTVTFTWKDYADNYRRKIMKLPATEFVRRFLLHVLPEGFKRIRYYGFLAPRARAKRLNRCRAFFGKPPIKVRKVTRRWYETVKELIGKDPLLCRACGSGRLRAVAILPRIPRALVVLSSG